MVWYRIPLGKLRTFAMLFVDNAYIGISAVGMTMVLITGGIDLSVAAVASLTGMFIAYGTTVLNIHPVICMAFSIVVGIALGLGMGALVTYLKIPPFVATLTGMFLARGVCSLISRDSISIDNDLIDKMAGWKMYFMKLNEKGEWVKIKPVAYINLNVVMFIVMIIIGTYILQKTRFGRNVYAIGGSESSAKLMGLPVGRTKVAVYAINGFCSARLDGDSLSYLSNLSVSTDEGVVYYGYISPDSHNYGVGTMDKYYVSGAGRQLLEDVSFVPAAGFGDEERERQEVLHSVLRGMMERSGEA